MPEPINELVQYQGSLFELFEEFFERATGVDAPSRFATFDTFSAVIRANAQRLTRSGMEALAWADENIRPFYASEAPKAFRNAQQIGGLKVVQGGGSGFLESQLGSVRHSLLYVDTVLIPDPVFPWFETRRAEERFGRVRLIEAVFSILHLKPFVDAGLHVLPVCVFPSFEKILDEGDETTRIEQAQLITDMFAHNVDDGLTEIAEVLEFADEHEDVFLKRVNDSGLFVAPGGPIGEPIDAALRRYIENLETWRSREWLDYFRELSPGIQILNGISERLGHQYHLLENSVEFASHPLLAVEQQAYYFRKVAQMNSVRLKQLEALNPDHEKLVQGLGDDRFRMLNNVPTEALIELRRNGENVEFRDRMLTAFSALHGATLEDIDKVASEIALEISRMKDEHDAQVKAIQEKYRAKYGQTAVGAWAGLSAAFVPALAPFIGAAAPFAVAGKYGWDKIAERRERRLAERSLVGVMAMSE